MTTNLKPLGLGIDAGGTFTDGVILDLRSGKVLSKAKTPTRKDDLPQSIRRCLEGLDKSLLPGCVVSSLSTTFATNAIVESRGARAGVLLLGYDSYDIAKVQADCKVSVHGSHGIRGQVLESLDEDGLRTAVRQLVDGERVEALAISGMGAVMNPEHEIRAREIVREEADLPVVCGHELSMELDAIRRATTAYINARLLPIVVDLIHALESEVRAAGVNAPIMVVRSDGTSMSLHEALSHPIHTIFSGPAASAIGALYLSGCKAALIVDIGGTTTDILFAGKDGVAVSKEGSTVNGLNVSTPMVCAHTFGFGGDSIVRRDRENRLTIGPERVIPVCVLSSQHPGILRELKSRKRGNASSLVQPVEFFVMGWAGPGVGLSPSEEKILEALESGPKSSDVLAKVCGAVHESLLQVDRLERWGAVMRSGLTPTDVMHVVGQFSSWDRDAAQLAVEVYATAMGVESAAFCELVLEKAQKSLSREILSAAFSGASGQGMKSASRLADSVLGHSSDFAKLSAEISRPVIGIGAPVQAYLPAACESLGVQPVIPEHSEVANALGAVVGRIAVKAKAVISPGSDGYGVHTPLEFRRFGELELAEEYAEEQVRLFLDTRVREDYEGFQFRVEVGVERRFARSAIGEVLVESVVAGTAVECGSMGKGLSGGG